MSDVHKKSSEVPMRSISGHNMWENPLYCRSVSALIRLQLCWPQPAGHMSRYLWKYEIYPQIIITMCLVTGRTHPEFKTAGHRNSLFRPKIKPSRFPSNFLINQINRESMKNIIVIHSLIAVVSFTIFSSIHQLLMCVFTIYWEIYCPDVITWSILEIINCGNRSVSHYLRWTSTIKFIVKSIIFNVGFS